MGQQNQREGDMRIGVLIGSRRTSISMSSRAAVADLQPLLSRPYQISCP